MSRQPVNRDLREYGCPAGKHAFIGGEVIAVIGVNRPLGFVIIADKEIRARLFFLEIRKIFAAHILFTFKVRSVTEHLCDRFADKSGCIVVIDGRRNDAFILKRRRTAVGGRGILRNRAERVLYFLTDFRIEMTYGAFNCLLYTSPSPRDCS